ncbi:hypothetical protein SNEBB_001815 [Seison nebaliae]|nr:hypothetical protein SNEBB_001815 [Seison nebaliae]
MNSEKIETKRIAEEFRKWKKNTSFLYDLFYTSALEWSSPFVQFLPMYLTQDLCELCHSISNDDEVNNGRNELQLFMMGTQPIDEPSLLMIGSTLIPDSYTLFNENVDNLEKKESAYNEEYLKYIPSNGNGFGEYRSLKNRIRIVARYYHDDGSLSCAKCSIFQSNVDMNHLFDKSITVVTGTKEGRLGIFRVNDLLGYGEYKEKEERELEEKEKNENWKILKLCREEKNHQMENDIKELEKIHIFKGFNGEIINVEWNPFLYNRFASICDEETNGLTLLDIERKSVNQSMNLRHRPVDISWNKSHPYLLSCLTERNDIQINDIRLKKNIIHINHTNEEYQRIEFNPVIGHLFAVGGSSSRIYDMRKLNETFVKLPSTSTDDDEMEDMKTLQLNWHPTLYNILSQSSSNRRTYVWDINNCENKIDEKMKNYFKTSVKSSIADDNSYEQYQKSIEDVKLSTRELIVKKSFQTKDIPNLIFAHGGNTGPVTSVDWRYSIDVAMEKMYDFWTKKSHIKLLELDSDKYKEMKRKVDNCKVLLKMKKEKLPMSFLNISMAKDNIVQVWEMHERILRNHFIRKKSI